MTGIGAKSALFAAAAVFVVAGPVSTQQVRLDTGSAPEELRTILDSASLLRTLKSDGSASNLDFIAAAQADYRRLLTGLYSEGYYGGSVSILVDGREAATIAPLDPPDTIERIRITVHPGPQFTFGRAEVAPLAPGTILPEGFATGQVARSDTVREAVVAAVDGWRDEGRAKAAPVGQTVVARHPDQQLDASVQIDPGPVLTFGALSVSGNRLVREDRIREIAGLPRGDVYSPDEVDRVEARLRRTGAFRSVTMVESDTISEGNRLDFDIQVAEQKPRRRGYGVEYSTVEGLTLSGYWMHRNFLGGAENLRFDAKIAGLGGETGGIDYTLSGAFLRPATFHVDTDLFVNASYQNLDEPSYQLEMLETDVGLTRIIGNDLTVSGALGYVVARVNDGLGDRTYSLVTAPVTAELDKRDDPVDATTGYYVNLELTPFVGFGDAASGGRLFAETRAYRSFGEADRVTLAFRGQAGTVIGPDITATPTDFAFYSGGGDTVRGQEYQSLGVNLGSGVTVGGLSFLATSAEVRVDVTDTIGVVGFYDTGFVGADALSLDNGAWHSGAGIGLRYETGIGPIRVDIATPASGPNAGQSVSFYVGIGQSF